MVFFNPHLLSSVSPIRALFSIVLFMRNNEAQQRRRPAKKRPSTLVASEKLGSV